ncbi:MAG: hypothetical protein FWF51_01345 [Chitinivibrionia bacterium]|nr:hypothetical protein [Chitinivibrionia bacterium]
MLKKIIGGVVLAGISCAVFATDARVETMGNSDHFFRDEISIHRNAANMGMYDNIMFGSYGAINVNPENTGGAYLTPKSPLFGGMISFGQKEGSLSKFSIGAAFNRVDSALNYVAFNIDSLGLRTTKGDNKLLLFAGNRYNGDGNNPSGQIDLVGKVDLMFAKTLENGTTIGLGAYLAFLEGSTNEVIESYPIESGSNGLKNRFIKGNVGVNTPIGDGVDLEASVGISTLTLKGRLNADGSDSLFRYAADNDIGIQIDVRMFADIASLNGAFVPHIQANIFNYNGSGDSDTAKNDKIIDINAGLGLNINIDRGFFWTGFEGRYNKKSVVISSNTPDINGVRKDEYGKKDIIGGKIGFGIERNVLTDWFVIRVGGSKLLAKESIDKENGGYKWIETDDGDHVSLGMGVNVEERLKIDFTVAKNLPYTFTGLFSSSSNPYLVSRVSAVFAF